MSCSVRAALLNVLSLISRIGDPWLHWVEEGCSRFSRNKSLVIIVLGLAELLIRLALLPVLPVPVPAIHDEFSYLLAADTFAHGRLTNPPHAMWVFLDTFHVLQQPTYASKYPPAPGAFMALGQLLGSPWFGVLLTLVAMVMAMTWALQGWFSPPWALLGGVLLLLKLGLVNPWMQNFYDSGVGLLGAALVLGAFPRVLKLGRARDAFLMGLGAVILASSRPLEGLIFCLPVAITLVTKLISKAPHSVKAAVPRVFVCLSIVLISGLGFLAFYNWRVTHNPLLFPYVLYHQKYFNYPIFAWQTVRPPLHYDNREFETYFNSWHRSFFALTWRGWKLRTWDTFSVWWHIYVGSALALPFFTLFLVVKDRRMRLPVSQFVICAVGLVSVVWFQPSYAAPLAATLYVLLVQALRHLRHLKVYGRPLGFFLTRLVVILLLVWVVIRAERDIRAPIQSWGAQRVAVAKKLQALPGKHLVLVRYSPEHDVHKEWVYNEAGIDAAKIVWARVIPDRDFQPLLTYFNSRRVWILYPDTSPPTIEAYSPSILKP